MKKQLNAGRPKTAVDKSNLPEKPLTSALPKTIIGSHMGMMSKPPKPMGPAISRPIKLPPKPPQAPPAKGQ